MEKGRNYLTQAENAKARFLTYDQSALIRKLGAKSDAEYIYVNFLCKPYRISRTTGAPEYWDNGAWQDGGSFEEVMTLLDLVCDSQEDRHPAGQWVSMESLGRHFHRNLVERGVNPVARQIEADPEAFRAACLSMGGERVPGADIGYSVELFEGLRVAVQFWFGDDEFPARVRYLWDANALQYLRYETTYFAVNLLVRRIFQAAARLSSSAPSGAVPPSTAW
ncbi:MAG: DUF3786 domain-containing protein [Firmicutes bacterium]|nr:DUF3786 domain-containing protein [Bacillota bacterium]